MKLIKPFFTLLLIIILGACSADKKGVYFSEMSENPKITVQNDKLIIQTKNSSKHSALLIYEVNATTNKENKFIDLTANQGLNKEYQERFEIDLSKLGIVDDINQWNTNWVDPDGAKTKLKIEN